MSHQTPETESAPGSLNLLALARLFLRTWPYLKPQWKHILAWLGLRAVAGVSMLFLSLIAFDLLNNKVFLGHPLDSTQAAIFGLDSSYVETDALSNEQRRTVRDRLVMLLIPGLLLLLGVVVVVVPYYEMWFLQRINQQLRVTMIERAEHLSLRYHDRARTGDAIYRVFQDSSMITAIILNLILVPLQIGGGTLFAVVVVSIFSPVLGLACLMAAIPILGLVAWYTPRLQRRAWHARQSNSALTSRTQEAFAGIRVIKANQAEASIMRSFDRDSNVALDNAFLLRLEMVSMRIAMVFIAGAALIAAKYLMAGWTLNEESTWLAGAIALVGFSIWNLGAFRAASERAEKLVEGGQALIYVWGLVQDMAMGLERAFFLLDIEPDVVDGEDAAGMPTPIRSVTYRNVHFGYEADRPVLKGVNLEARAGTVTAIVGATGSGKTTLMTLLLRLYNPDEGTVAINGVDYGDIRVDDLRANTAIALQQNVLFATTISENIGYATKDASRQDIEAAAKVACADTFIEAMENGYDTELGERGGKLSVGQRQRLTIARAVVRDTPILILDEPTAALDAETEQAVLANLGAWGRGRVLFLITHRLSTIRNADQIAFLEDGRIVEVGDHDTLMAIPDGRYRNFVLTETEGDEAGGGGAS